MPPYSQGNCWLWSNGTDAIPPSVAKTPIGPTVCHRSAAEGLRSSDIEGNRGLGRRLGLDLLLAVEGGNGLMEVWSAVGDDTPLDGSWSRYPMVFPSSGMEGGSS